MKISEKAFFFITIFFLSFTFNSLAANNTSSEPTLIGFKIRIGGRYDNVRKCVASETGIKGGIAADISLFTDVPIDDRISLHVDLPVMRPILFGLAFHMLQFEPTVAIKFSDKINNKIEWVAGPAMGVSMHYGPDYNSEESGPNRTSSFFAMGPIVGAYAGLNFARNDENFNFQLGLSPYVIPLFGINDPQNHKGIVIGGLADCIFRFGNSN